MSEKDNLINSIRDANDIARLISGKTLLDLAGEIANLCGWDVARKVLEDEIPEPGSPYAVLGVRPKASMAVIRLAYRKLIRESKTEELGKINDAYLKILSLRGEG